MLFHYTVYRYFVRHELLKQTFYRLLYRLFPYTLCLSTLITANVLNRNMGIKTRLTILNSVNFSVTNSLFSHYCFYI